MFCDGIGCAGCYYCDPLEDPGLQRYLAECTAHCQCCDRCCPSVCHGVASGGLCDDDCHCEQEGGES